MDCTILTKINLPIRPLLSLFPPTHGIRGYLDHGAFASALDPF
jgi:hypothetical protein